MENLQIYIEIGEGNKLGIKGDLNTERAFNAVLGLEEVLAKSLEMDRVMFEGLLHVYSGDMSVEAVQEEQKK